MREDTSTVICVAASIDVRPSEIDESIQTLGMYRPTTTVSIRTGAGAALHPPSLQLDPPQVQLFAHGEREVTARSLRDEPKTRPPLDRERPGHIDLAAETAVGRHPFHTGAGQIACGQATASDVGDEGVRRERAHERRQRQQE